MKPPCYGCGVRWERCHVSCALYARWCGERAGKASVEDRYSVERMRSARIEKIRRRRQ